MINEKLTLELFGYTSNELTKGSGKKIIKVCNECGKENPLPFKNYNNINYSGLCAVCAKKGKITEKSKQKMRDNHAHITGKDNPNWKGGIAGNRDHVKLECKCIQLNKRFNGSHAHHIMSGVVIFIPKDLHRSIYHNMKNGKGMKEINALALNYLIKEL